MTQSSQAPAIILVEPQLSENIGTAARAMMNCSLSDLRLVRPRPDWLSDRAIAAASGADGILHNAKIFERTEDAVAGLRRVYATTGRGRTMVKPIVVPRRAAQEIRLAARDGQAAGVMFGRERTGLENDDLNYADTIITVPLNPEHCSLNLAQAVLLIGYEWFQAADETPDLQIPMHGTRPATKDEILNFYTRLERELDQTGFLRNEEMRPSMVRNIRSMFDRAHLTEQEVRTLHGMLTELAHTRKHRLIEMVRSGQISLDEGQQDE